MSIVIEDRSPRSQLHNYCPLAVLLLKNDKTEDDAIQIFNEIKKFPIYERFLKNTFRFMDQSKQLDMIRQFQYERLDMGKFVFKEGDASNNKFYIILQGEVAVIIKTKLGNWGRQTIKKTRTTTKILNTLKQTSKADQKLTRSKEGSLTNIDHHGSGQRSGENTPAQGSKIPNFDFVDNNNKTTGTLSRQDSLGETTPGYGKFAMGSLSHLDNFKGDLAAGSRYSMNLNDESTPVSNLESTVSFAEYAARRQQNQDGFIKEENSSDGEDEEEEDDDSDVDDKEYQKYFEDYVKRYGKVVRYMKAGEGFGEIALTNNKPRTASIMTKTPVEMIVLTKKNYDEVFSNVERQREDFLKSTFPMFEEIGASQNLRYLLFSFKTKSYNRGEFLTIEGPVQEKEAKVHLIMTGQCSVEKKMKIDLENPYQRRETILSKEQNIVISQAGQGVMVGEEVLQQQGQSKYEFTVRVLSEYCMVQTLLKKDMNKFPADFHTFFKQVYNTKKKQREAAIDKVKFEVTQRKEVFKNKNVYSQQNAYMVGLINKSALAGFNKLVKREIEIQNTPKIVKKKYSSPQIQTQKSKIETQKSIVMNSSTIGGGGIVNNDQGQSKPSLPIPEPRKKGLFTTRDMFIERKKSPTQTFNLALTRADKQQTFNEAAPPLALQKKKIQQVAFKDSQVVVSLPTDREHQMNDNYRGSSSVQRSRPNGKQIDNVPDDVLNLDVKDSTNLKTQFMRSSTKLAMGSQDELNILIGEKSSSLKKKQKSDYRLQKVRGFNQKIIRSKNMNTPQGPQDKFQSKIEFIKNFKLKENNQKDPLKYLQQNKLFADDESDVQIERMKKVRAYRNGHITHQDLINYPNREMEPVDLVLAKFLEIKDFDEDLKETKKCQDSPRIISYVNNDKARQSHSPALDQQSPKDNIKMYSSHDDLRGTFSTFTQHVMKKGLAILRANSPKISQVAENSSHHFNQSHDNVSTSNIHIKQAKSRIQSPTSGGGGGGGKTSSHRQIHTSQASYRNMTSNTHRAGFNTTSTNEPMTTESLRLNSAQNVKPQAPIHSRLEFNQNKHRQSPRITNPGVALTIESTRKTNDSALGGDMKQASRVSTHKSSIGALSGTRVGTPVYKNKVTMRKRK